MDVAQAEPSGEIAATADVVPGDVVSSNRRVWMAMGLGGFAVVVTTLVAILRNKVVSTQLGPEGLGLWGQLSALAALLSYFANFGADGGITRYLSQALARGDQRRATLVVHTAAAVLCATASVCLVAGALLIKPLTIWLLGAGGAVAWVWWLLPVIPLSAIAALGSGVMRANQRIERLAAVQSLTALAALAMLIVLAQDNDIERLIVLPAATALVQAVLFIGAAAPDLFPRLRPLARDAIDAGARRADGELARAIFGYGMTGVLVIGATVITIVTVRRSFVAQGALDVAGQCVALSALAEAVLALIGAANHSQFLPALVTSDTAGRLTATFRQILRRLALAATALLVVVVALGTIVIPLLYSRQFLPVVPLLGMQAIAIFARALSTYYNLAFLARARLAPPLITHASACALLLVLFYALEPSLGLLAYVVAHVAASVLQWGVLARLASTRLQVTLDRTTALLLAGCFGVLVIVLLAERLRPL